jgi:ATP-dependent Clp protease ATP-binding subunit ClpA
VLPPSIWRAESWACPGFDDLGDRLSENRLKSVIEEVRSSPRPIILFIDEAHTLVGAGAAAGQSDAANLLKPAFARGELRTIAATTWAEYKKYFEKDAALTRRFQVVKVEEPSEATAIAMIRGLVGTLEEHHRVRILDEALAEAVRLSARYIPSRQLPDKAVSLIDTACARVAMSQSAIPAAIEDRQRQLALIDTEVAIIDRETATGIDHAARKAELTEERAQAAADLEALNARWEEEKRLAAEIAAARQAIEDPGDGVDKDLARTRLAAATAELREVQGERPLIFPVVDGEEHKVSLLMGSPPGYVGYGEGGVLTEAVRRRPYSVILLDEMEKAHPGVQDVFYQVFDKGTMRDGEGRDIDFKNTVIIMTSNAGTELIDKLFADPETVPDAAGLAEALGPELLKFFKPAFLGRVRLVPYLPLSDQVIRQIVGLQLGHIRARVFDSYRARFEHDPALLEAIAARCTETGSGARNIEKILSGSLLPELSAEVLARLAEGRPIGCVHVGMDPSGSLSYTLN